MTTKVHGELIQIKTPVTGSVTRTLQDKLGEFVSVSDFGAVGDGVTDDTAAIQAAITYCRLQGGFRKKLHWTSGTYLITNYLNIGSDICVEFDQGVTINLTIFNQIETTSVFSAAGQHNITFYGNGTIINGTRTGAIVEGNAAGFYLYACSNVFISDFVINNMATDGITITGDTTGSGPCDGVTISNCTCNNSRRNGLSIIHGRNIKIFGGKYINSNGAPSGPWAGIDIEPNSGQTIENVLLSGVYTSNNPGGGLEFVPMLAGTTTSGKYEVTVIGGKSVSDGDVYGRVALRFINGATPTNKINGFISIRDYVIDSPLSNGVGLFNWNPDKCPPIVLENVTVINPDSTSTASTNDLRVAFLLYHQTSDTATYCGGIKIINCSAVDNRATPRMPWGFRINADTGRCVKDVTIINPYAVGYTFTSTLEVLDTAAGVTGGQLNVVVRYDNINPVNISASSDITGYVGKRVNVITSSTNITLPFANNCYGSVYEIQTAIGINSVSILPQSTDTIKWPIDIVNTSIVLDSGGLIILKSIGTNSWRVENLQGQWRRQGTVSPRITVYMASAPVGQTWTQGDRAINSSPSVGQPKSWVCTVSGTPGTWVSEGVL